MPPTSPIDDFNAQLALAKIEALNCLLRLCRNEDGAASPEEIRRAASAILRCPPLRPPPDPTGGTGVPPVRAPSVPTRTTKPPRPLSPTERRLLDDYYARHPRQHQPTTAAAISPAQTPAFTHADHSQPAAPSATLTKSPHNAHPPRGGENPAPNIIHAHTDTTAPDLTSITTGDNNHLLSARAPPPPCLDALMPRSLDAIPLIPTTAAPTAPR